MFIFSLSYNALAQNKSNYIRVAKIVVDSALLENYKAALKEGIETAVYRTRYINVIRCI